MKRFSILILGALVLLIASQPGRSADPAAEKFEKAKMKFEEDGKKIAELVTKYFDDKEKQARTAGNKKLVDQIKDERKAYEELGILTGNAPANLKKMIVAQRSALEAAYTQAIKDFTRAKKDGEAAAIEKEWKALQKLQASNKGLIRVAPPGNLWVSLFNGKDLTGWSNLNNREAWKVVDKAIQGVGFKNVGGLNISTMGLYDNFSLRMEMWLAPKTFSRIEFRNGANGSCWVGLHSNPDFMGSIGSNDSGVLGKETKTTKNPPVEKWFTLEITAVDHTTIVRMDSEVIGNASDEKLVLTSGKISLSVDGDSTIVRIRKMEILPFPKK